MLKVKICGVTRVEDAVAAVELGADLLGLNFWPGSPRCLDLAAGRRLADAVRGRVTLVGVFVDQPAELLERALGEVGLDLVQLHGDEPAAEVARFGARALEALRVGPRFDPAALSDYPSCWGFLFDRYRAGSYGGTGEEWAYEQVRGLAPDRPVLVAGGIRPGRVAAVVARAAPWGIDVCSGVERAPGIKDRELMSRLFEEVRHGQQAAMA